MGGWGYWPLEKLGEKDLIPQHDLLDFLLWVDHEGDMSSEGALIPGEVYI